MGILICGLTLPHDGGVAVGLDPPGCRGPSPGAAITIILGTPLRASAGTGPPVYGVGEGSAAP